MIDVKSTILETIKERVNKLRFLGENNPKTFKKIISLIVLDDLYEWSNYLNSPQEIQKKLQEMRKNYILCQRDFNIKYLPQEEFYVNVNTPQTDFTWSRVWDDPETVTVESAVQVLDKSIKGDPFIPDNTCPVSIQYFGGQSDSIPEDPNTHTPSVDFKSLTICEKMNIYINRNTGQMFYLDPQTCTWQVLKGELASAVSWNSIVDRPSIYGNIKHNLIPEGSRFNVSLNEMVKDAETGQWIVDPSKVISDDVAITGDNELIDDVL